jgi:hypothetical protein
VVNSASSPLSFFLSASTVTTYIFTAPTCTTTIITLEPCALNAEFQHFILRFNKFSLLSQIPPNEAIVGEREGDFTDNFNARICNYRVVSFEIHEVAMGGLVGTMVKIPKFL